MNTKPVEIVYEMRFALFSILIRFHFVLSPLHLASSLEFAICRDKRAKHAKECGAQAEERREEGREGGWESGTGLCRIPL